MVQGIRALLFDKDGTLVDFDRTWGPAAGSVMRELANGNLDRLAALHDVSAYLPEEARFLPTSPLVAGSSGDYGPLWASALRCEPGPAFLARIDFLFAREGLRHLTPIGNPFQTLSRLAATGLALAMVTNDAEENARQQCAALGIAPFFYRVLGYDSGHGAKPHPGMIHAAAAAKALRPADVAVVGDTIHDHDAARAAGALFILVRSGPAPSDQLARHADLVIDTIDQLPTLFAAARSA